MSVFYANETVTILQCDWLWWERKQMQMRFGYAPLDWLFGMEY